MKRGIDGILIGIGIVVFLLIIEKVFRIDGEIMSPIYGILMLVFLAAALISYLYIRSYAKRVGNIVAPQNTEEAKELISKMETLLQTAKGRNLRNALKINLAVGYIAAKQFDTALSMLERLAHERYIVVTIKLCCLINLYISYFFTEQYVKAVELYEANIKIFKPYRNDKVYGGNIAAMEILKEIKNGQYELAERQLQIAQQAWTNNNIQNQFQILEIILKLRDKPQE